MVGTGVTTRFVGTFEHTLDDKGRLILPASFRPKLAEGAYVTSLDHCLAILPPEEFDNMADQLESRIASGQGNVSALRAFASKADEVVPDSQGRVRLLPHLREVAELDRAVIVTGALRHIEIWNPARWDIVSAEGTEKLAEAIEAGHALGVRS
jgi:MraZ protein